METTMHARPWFRLLAVPVLVLAAVQTTSAADVRDEAGLFSAEAVRSARATLSRIESDSKLPITIETIDTLGGRSIDAVTPELARSQGLKGLFVLIAKKEHKIEAMASNDYSKYFPVARRKTIEDAFIPEFKQNRFDQGLATGVTAIDSVVSRAKADAGGSFTRTVAPAAPAPAPARRGVPAPVPAQGGRGFGMGSVIGIVLLLFGVMIVFRILGAVFGGGRQGYGAGPGMGMGRGMGPGGPGYGGPGYGPGYGGGGGGGGFFSSMFGGIGGALAGNWLYDQFTGRRHHDSYQHYDQGVTGLPPDQPAGPDWTSQGDGGSDWGDSGGGSGGGSDWGGTAGGGGGGDWGGGGGGSDWGGGGGGDWGGGGGSDNGGSW